MSVVYLLEISVGSYEHRTSVHYAFSTPEKAKEEGSRIVSRIKSYREERKQAFVSSDGREERHRTLAEIKERYQDLSDFISRYLDNPSYDITELEVRA